MRDLTEVMSGKREEVIKMHSSRAKNSSFTMNFLIPILCIFGDLISSVHCLSAHPQDYVSDKPFLSPFMEEDKYKIIIIGDDFAKDLNESLMAVFKDHDNLNFGKLISLDGQFLPKNDEKIGLFEQSLREVSPNIALILMGVPDPSAMRDLNGRRLIFGSFDWRTEYKERLNRFLQVFKKYNIAVYLVSFPPFKTSDINERARVLNDIFRETAFINEMRYIDIYSSFLDDAGRYTSLGPDLDGTIIKIRNSDGEGFTKGGETMLAHFIERVLNRDLKEAQDLKQEPLVGSETEQTKINPEKPLLKRFDTNKQYTNVTETLNGATPYKFSGEDIPADNDKVTITSKNKMGRDETITIDILRPSLSSSIVTLLSQKNNEYKKSKLNEKLVTPMKNGLILLNTITLPRLEDLEPARSKIPPTQTSFYKLLIKGERLAPKPGRADDPLTPSP